jgi:hypothetical protein
MAYVKQSLSEAPKVMFVRCLHTNRQVKYDLVDTKLKDSSDGLVSLAEHTYRCSCVVCSNPIEVVTHRFSAQNRITRCPSCTAKAYAMTKPPMRRGSIAAAA